MGIDALILLLIYLIAIVAIAYAAFWVIGQSIPPPMQMFAKLIVGVIALLCLVYLLVHVSGVGLGGHLLR